MLGPLREHKNDRGYVLIVVVLMMLAMAVMAAGMNRRAAMQARVTANQTLNSQVHLGQIAALQQAAWTLSRHPSWRTSAAGEIFPFSGIDYTRTVLDSSMGDFSNVVTVTVKAPEGSKDFTTSFRLIPQKRLYYLIADAENNVIRSVDTTTGTITTFAGNGTPGDSGDGGPATDAQLNYPTGLCADQSGNVFIADTMNHRIRKVDPQGTITPFAGNGIATYFGDNVQATDASLNGPEAVALDGLGNLYIADTQNHCIRKVDGATGIITTVAGTPTQPGYKMDGGPALNAKLNEPQGLYVDASGNLFIADTGNCIIREVGASDGKITTKAGINPAVSTSCGDSGDGPATETKLDRPHGVYVDKDGNIYIADEGNHRIRKVDITTGNITTIAGNGVPAYGGDGGPAIDASLQNPKSVWVDVNGNLLIADNENNRIRKVSVTTGDISTAAGNGIAGYWGDHGPAIDARLKKPHRVCAYESPAPAYLYFSDPSNYQIRRVDLEENFLTKTAGTIWAGYNGDNILATWANLNYPFGVHVDDSGNVLIADTYNHRIRKVNAKTGIITTVAGNGSKGFYGDGGPATSARLRYPFSVYGDATGNIYIADTYNYRIRKVNAKTGIITTVAGDGSAKFRGDGGLATEASIKKAYDLAVDREGNLYIVDTDNHCIRQVDATTGIIDTVVGQGMLAGFSGDGGLATDARLNTPTGVCVDAAGNIYVTDTNNDVVRKVDAITKIINTVAGNGNPGFSGDGGLATQAQLDYPEGVWVDSSGNIFIVDTNNCRIRMVDGNTGIITTVAGTSSCGYNGNNQPATDAALYYPSDISVYEPSSIEWLPQIYRQSN
jgi:sugar lactone lactonase YvrE